MVDAENPAKFAEGFQLVAKVRYMHLLSLASAHMYTYILSCYTLDDLHSSLHTSTCSHLLLQHVHKHTSMLFPGRSPLLPTCTFLLSLASQHIYTCISHVIPWTIYSLACMLAPALTCICTHVHIHNPMLLHGRSTLLPTCKHLLSLASAHMHTYILPCHSLDDLLSCLHASTCSHLHLHTCSRTYSYVLPRTI